MTKIDTFLNFDQYREFPKFLPKSKFFENFGQNRIFFRKFDLNRKKFDHNRNFSKIWTKGKFFENWTKIEIFRNIRKKEAIFSKVFTQINFFFRKLDKNRNFIVNCDKSGHFSKIWLNSKFFEIFQIIKIFVNFYPNRKSWNIWLNRKF